MDTMQIVHGVLEKSLTAIINQRALKRPNLVWRPFKFLGFKLFPATAFFKKSACRLQ
jgi:hypothetical protein